MKEFIIRIMNLLGYGKGAYFNSFDQYLYRFQNLINIDATYEYIDKDSIKLFINGVQDPFVVIIKAENKVITSLEIL